MCIPVNATVDEGILEAGETDNTKVSETPTPELTQETPTPESTLRKTTILEDENEENNKDIKVQSDTDDKWLVKVNWGDASDNLPDNWCPEYTSEQNIIIKEQVTIECKNSVGKVYNPGEVTVKLSDVKGVDSWNYNNNKRLVRDISAIKQGMSGTGDWYYTETLNENTGCYDYVFSNKNTISTSFTSTFQIVLTFVGNPSASTKYFGAARYFKVGYEQDVKAILNVEDEVTESNTLHYSWKGTKDTYNLKWGEAKELDWGNSILSLIPKENWSDYIFVNLELNANFNEYSSIAVENGNHVDLKLGDGVIIGTPYKNTLYSNLMSKNLGHSDESFLKDCDSTKEYYKATYSVVKIPVAIPRTYLDINGGVLELVATWYGTYCGDNSESLLASDTMSINLNNFDTVYTGDLYALSKKKNNPYQNYLESMRNFYNKEKISGVENSWSISATAVYYGKSYNAIIGDDMQYVIYDDNTYRKLEDDERVVSKIALFRPKEITECNYEVYGKLLGGSGKYELVLSGVLNDSTSGWAKTISTDVKRYYDIKVKLLNLTGSLDKSKTLLSVSTYSFDNNALDAGKKITDCYNFSYLQIEMDDKLVSMSYDTVTNLTGLDEEIKTTDSEIYGDTVLRETDKIPIREISYSARTSTESEKNTYLYDSSISGFTGTVRFAGYVYNISNIASTINSYTEEITMPNYVDFSVNDFKFKPRTKTSQRPSESAFLYTKEEIESLENIKITIKEKTDGNNKILSVTYDLTANPVISQDGENYINLHGIMITGYVSSDDYYMMNLKGTKTSFENAITNINLVNNYTGLTYKPDFYDSTWTLTFPNLARSSYQGIDKEVKNSTGYYTKEPITVQEGEDYSYKLRLSSGNTRMAKIVLYDNIENYIQDSWKGEFSGYSLDSLEKAGIDTSNFKIYYSENRNQKQDLNTSGWIASTDWTGKLSNVKSIAFDLDGYVLTSDSILYVEVHMKAPTSITAEPGETTKNQTTVSYTEYDSTDTDLKVPLNEVTNLPSNIVSVSMNNPERKLTIVKTINVDDIWWAHGTPTFLFKIESIGEESVVRYVSMEFDKEYVSENKEGSGKNATVSMSYEITLPMDNYKVTELHTSRYEVFKIEAENETEMLSDGATFDMIKNEEGSIHYTNKCFTYSDYNHNDIIVNHIYKKGGSVQE